MSRPTSCWQKLPGNELMKLGGLVIWLISCVLRLIQTPVLILALVLMLLSGCANTEPTPQYLYRAVPRVWTDTIAEPSLDGTYGAYMARCELFIKQCNADRESVRRWSDEADGAIDGAPGTP